MAFSIEPDEASFLEYFDTTETWPAISLQKNMAHRKMLLKSLCKKIDPKVLNYFIISSTWRDFFAKNERMNSTELKISNTDTLSAIFCMLPLKNQIPIFDRAFLNAYYLLSRIPETYRNLPGLSETVLSMLGRPLHNEAIHAYLNQLIRLPHKKVMHQAFFNELKTIPGLDLSTLTEETAPSPEIIDKIQTWQTEMQIHLETLRHHLIPLLQGLPHDTSTFGPQLLQLFADLRNALLQGANIDACDRTIEAALQSITKIAAENPAAAPRPLVDSDESEKDEEEVPLTGKSIFSETELRPMITAASNDYFQAYPPLECLNRYQQMDRYKVGDKVIYDPLFFNILESLNLEARALKTWIQNTLIQLLPKLPHLFTRPAEESDDEKPPFRYPTGSDISIIEVEDAQPLDAFFCFHIAHLLKSLRDYDWLTADPAAIGFLKQQSLNPEVAFTAILAETLILKYFGSECSSTTKNLLTALLLKTEIDATKPLDHLIYQAFIKNFPNIHHDAQTIMAVFNDTLPALERQADLLSLSLSNPFEGTGPIFCPISSFYDLIVDLFALVKIESAQLWLESLFKKAASADFIPESCEFKRDIVHILNLHDIPTEQHAKMTENLFVRFLSGLTHDETAMKEIQSRTKAKIASYGEKTVLINYTSKRLTALFLAFKMAYDKRGHTQRNRFAKGTTAALLLLCTGLFSVCAYGIITHKKIGLESLLPEDMPHAGNLAPLLGSMGLSVATGLIYAISHQCYFNTDSLAQLSGSLRHLDISNQSRYSQKTKLATGLVGTLSLSGLIGWLLYLGITDQLYSDLGGELTAQNTPNNKAAQGTTTAIMILAQLFVVLLPTLLYKIYGACKINMPPEHSILADRMEEDDTPCLSDLPAEVSEDRGSYKGPANALNGFLVGYTPPILLEAASRALRTEQGNFIPKPLSQHNPFRYPLPSYSRAGAGSGTGVGLNSYSSNSSYSASGGPAPFKAP
ncbi:MAG: hypothetical protein NTV32_07375 [Gammaproteobacteria bacterium]|nr:hypothetical protein [Gammaproteobacteria bacterium]